MQFTYWGRYMNEIWSWFIQLIQLIKINYIKQKKLLKNLYKTLIAIVKSGLTKM